MDAQKHVEHAPASSAFVSGICEFCRTPWTQRVVANASYKRRYCDNGCRRAAEKQRRYERTYAESKAQYRRRRNDIARRIKSGELTDQVGNQCPACEKKVSMDSEPLTGRTVQTCGCGTTFIGRWA